LFGFLGVMLAVPVAAAIGVLVRYALAKYLDSRLYDHAPSELAKMAHEDDPDVNESNSADKTSGAGGHKPDASADAPA
jgi:hypothetical protein